MIERQYKGQMIGVVVLHEGFEYEGKRYRSLTAGDHHAEPDRKLEEARQRRRTASRDAELAMAG